MASPKVRSHDNRMQSSTPQGAGARHGEPRTGLFYECVGRPPSSAHDLANKLSVTRSLCALLGIGFAGCLDPDSLDSPPAEPLLDAGFYLVPSHTLNPNDPYCSSGKLDAARFFGGFVPHPFVASKLITHELVRPDALAPDGWSHGYGRAIRDAVLPGRSVFSAADARLAMGELLALGSVRLKEGDGVGGAGQRVMRSRPQLDRYLRQIDPQALTRDGLVLEHNLAGVTTCSVGQVQVGRWFASYHGTQSLTRNGRGHEVYGGSTLTVVPGDLANLLSQAPSDSMRLAIEQALLYQREAFRCFGGLVASRCNYDVIQGIDAGGRWRSGVLEQSWRVGGASGAEIAALHAFAADPALRRVRASTREVYGAAAKAPAGATVHFDGADQHGDRLLKYVEVNTDVDF